MLYLAEQAHPQAERIRSVCDNLSTHSPAAFYETFPPEEARRLALRFEFTYIYAGSQLVVEHSGV